MEGEVDAPLDPLQPPPDNLILGPTPQADALTITVGLGASMFDDRYGLADRRPTRLVEMPAFPHDQLAPERIHGDLVVQICGGTNETCIHALRRLMRATRDSMVVRWMVPGFNQPNTLGPGRTSTRNLLGFKDGTANLDPADTALMDDLVWVAAGGDEPAWAAGGSYHVVRIIRMRVEFWDRTPLRTQETIIGRHKDTGAPLGATAETDVPDFAADPERRRSSALDGHIRLANPRTPDTRRQPDPAPRVLLLPRLRHRRPLRPGPAVPVLPARPRRRLRDGAEPAQRRGARGVHHPRRRRLLLRAARRPRRERLVRASAAGLSRDRLRR